MRSHFRKAGFCALLHNPYGVLTASLAAVLLSGSAPAHAQFMINPNFESSITSLYNASNIENTINSAISFYNTNITNAVTVTINFGGINTGLGQSTTTRYSVDYSAYATALHATATGNTSFLQSVPIQAANPVNGSTTVRASSAQLRTLGFGPLYPGTQNGTFDSFIELNFGVQYTNRVPVAGQYDLFSTVEHEINEALGLFTTLNHLNNGDPAPTGDIGSLDPYRYSANGVRSFDTGLNTAAYFSTDGGATPLVYFNQMAGGDFHDFASNGEPYDLAPEVQDAKWHARRQ